MEITWISEGDFFARERRIKGQRLATGFHQSFKFKKCNTAPPRRIKYKAKTYFFHNKISFSLDSSQLSVAANSAIGSTTIATSQILPSKLPHIPTSEAVPLFNSSNCLSSSFDISYQINLLMRPDRFRIPQLLKSSWSLRKTAKMATTTQPKLDITSTVRMNSGYEMPVLGYGVSHFLQILSVSSN
jgi:hypothetical protein